MERQDAETPRRGGEAIERGLGDGTVGTGFDIGESVPLKRNLFCWWKLRDRTVYAIKRILFRFAVEFVGL
jgi:hypothetical protein